MEQLSFDFTPAPSVAAPVTLFSTIHNAAHPKHGDNLRGEYGEILAILFFTQHGYRVAKASGDWYPYDLMVERHGVVTRVQVKTVLGKSGKYYKTRFSDSDEFDVGCIITDEGDVYVIPREKMSFTSNGRNKDRRFVLYPKHGEFLVGRFQGFIAADASRSVVSKLESCMRCES